MGFPVPALGDAHAAFTVAAALLGEGMSSPLLDRLRERRVGVAARHDVGRHLEPARTVAGCAASSAPSVAIARRPCS